MKISELRAEFFYADTDRQTDRRTKPMRKRQKNAWQQTLIMCGFFKIYTLLYIRNAGMIKNLLFKCRVLSACLLYAYMKH
jgi:hypothetical protein